MADEQAVEKQTPNEDQAEQHRSLWENQVVESPEYYANMAFVDETASDVTMLFGSFFMEDPDTPHRVCKARVVMSHHGFLSFADRVAKEAKFLRRLYKTDDVPSLENISEDEWLSAVEEVYG